MKRKALTLFLLIGNLSYFFGQQDSLAKPFYSEWNTISENAKKSTLENDTSINNQFNYFNKDYNGNYCLPSQEIVYGLESTDDLGLIFYRAPYNNHLLKQKDIRFYDTKKPYTRVFGLVGQRQEQFLSLLHTNNIGNFNYSVLFNRYKNKGFYKRQLGTCDNLVSTLHYSSKNSKYKIKGWIVSNQLKHEENGGIISQNNFDSLYRENKELISVQLSESKRVNRQLQAGLMQYFSPKAQKDSSSCFNLFHRIYYKQGSFVFVDEKPDPAYYESIFLDSSFTRDSSLLQTLNNQIGISGSLDKKKNIAYRISYRNELGIEKQFGTRLISVNTKEYILQRDTNYMNHFTELRSHISGKNSKIGISTEYAWAGFYKGNYTLQLNARFDQLFKNASLDVNYAQEKRNPDLFHLNYSSNHYRWKNNFEAVNNYQINGKLSISNGLIWIENYSQITENMIWFYTPDQPLQYTNSIFINRVSGGGKVKWKKLHLNASAHYQFTNTSEILSLPQVHLHSQLFFENTSVRKDAKIQIGFQLNYYSSFQSNAYSPGTNMYYVSGREICGNYPFIDFFLNAEIQPVKFFILIDHLNQGLSGSNYFLTPNLPMADRSIKFGFTWLFWD